MKNNIQKVVFGGGCFWCTEAVFAMVTGVVKITPGYAGGTTLDPSYEEVCSGSTSHAEVIEVQYDPSKVCLEQLLALFFASHNPTTPNRQGNDIGTQYRSIILYSDEGQKRQAIEFVEALQLKLVAPIVTEITRLNCFYPAEKYHHNYYFRNRNQPYCRNVIAPKLKKL